MSSSPRCVEFQTTDYDRAGEFLTGLYGSNIRMSGRRAGYSFRFTQMGTPAFSIGTAVQTDDMAFTVEWAASLFVLRAMGTSIDYTSLGAAHQAGPGEPFIVSTSVDGEPFRLRWVDGIAEATSLPFATVAQVADTDEPFRFTSLRPHSREAARHLSATIDYLADAMRDRQEAMAEPLVASASGRLLCASVLAAFPNTVLVEPTIEDRHDSHPRTLYRAMVFVDEHAHEDITVADIAAAAHVTIRALQHAFRRHRDITPMGYVRLVRLHHAHQELLAADPATGVTVTQIAARWGFFNPGRFARYYREAHGHTPYQTLLGDGP